jgi:hypothetical protein
MSDMKNVTYLLVALFMVSCGSNGKQSKYGQTIGTYLQTDKRGSKYDLKFKVIELNEQGTITVADSIAYLTDEFRKDNELIVRRVELAKKMTETLLAKEKNKVKSISIMPILPVWLPVLIPSKISHPTI